MNIIPTCALLVALLMSPLALAGDAKEKGDDKVVAPAKAIPEPGPKASFKTNLAWQIRLDGEHFSPGILDGNWGRKGEMAMKEWHYEEKPADWHTTPPPDFDHITAPYTVGASDLAEVGELSEDWNERAKLDRLRYPNLHECLAEKFHCTQTLLTRLNPGVKINDLKVGDNLIVPNLYPFPTPGILHGGKGAAAHHLKINLSEKTIRAFDANDRQLALFHCSVAKDKEKLPGRNAVVKTAALHPNYTFDPAGWPDVKNVDHKLLIAPGPRNPVGMAWIGLDLPGYGIHGNPKPELIGKTGSHGCFRLTNWDALALFSMVKIGMTVEIEGAPAAAAPTAEKK